MGKCQSLTVVACIKPPSAYTGLVPKAGTRRSAADKFMIKFVYKVIIIAPIVNGGGRFINGRFHFFSMASVMKREE